MYNLTAVKSAGHAKSWDLSQIYGKLIQSHTENWLKSNDVMINKNRNDVWHTVNRLIWISLRNVITDIAIKFDRQIQFHHLKSHARFNLLKAKPQTLLHDNHLSWNELCWQMGRLKLENQYREKGFFAP